MSSYRTAAHQAAAIAALVLCGCAGVTVHTDGGKKDNGIRYYEPAPFLLVYSDSKGGLTSRIVWLPDTTRTMTLKPYAYLAKNDASFKFDKGMLTESKTVADETVIPQAIVAALKTAAIAGVAAANKAERDETPTVPAPYLFRIEIKNGAAKLYWGDRSPAVINVTLAAPPKKN
jgi:hypothetical protein